MSFRRDPLPIGLKRVFSYCVSRSSDYIVSLLILRLTAEKAGIGNARHIYHINLMIQAIVKDLFLNLHGLGCFPLRTKDLRMDEIIAPRPVRIRLGQRLGQ